MFPVSNTKDKPALKKSDVIVWHVLMWCQNLPHRTIRFLWLNLQKDWGVTPLSICSDLIGGPSVNPAVENIYCCTDCPPSVPQLMSTCLNRQQYWHLVLESELRRFTRGDFSKKPNNISGIWIPRKLVITLQIFQSSTLIFVTLPRTFASWRTVFQFFFPNYPPMVAGAWQTILE